VAFVLDAVGFHYFDESGVYLEQLVPVLKGMLNLREKSGDLRKLSRSLGMPAASPALSKYSETIWRKLDSPATLNLAMRGAISSDLLAMLEMIICVIILMLDIIKI
jgi:hypothetical protein